MKNEKQTRLDEEIEITNAEESAVVTEEVNLLNRKPCPVVEYGVPQLFCIERVERNEKQAVQTGATEYNADQARIIVWYTITGHLVDINYNTTGATFRLNVWENTLNYINKIVLEQNTLIVSVVFEPKKIECTNKETGETVTKVIPSLLSVSHLSPDEIRQIKELIRNK